MALDKRPIDINFTQGVDTKTDSKQLPIGKFLTLVNSVFDVTGQLTKRNGFPIITKLPNANQTTLTTLNDNLVATGSNLYTYSQDISQWIDQGKIQPVQLETKSVVRASTGQTVVDTAIAPNGLMLTAYTDTDGQSYYQVSDSSTGQQVVSRVALVSGAKHPRAFILGRYFVITYLVVISASPHLQYIAMPMVNPQVATAPDDISTTVDGIDSGYDGVVANNNLYIGWSDAATQVKVTILTSTLILAPPAVINAHTADLMSISADTSSATAVIYVTFWDASSQDGFTAVFNQNLTAITAATQTLTNVNISHLVSIADSDVVTIVTENINNYNSVGAYPTANIRTDYVSKVTMTQTGTVGSYTTVLRSVGLGSKLFMDELGTIYMLVEYGYNTAQSNQPTYFLIDITGAIYMRLAGTNAGGYGPSQVLPSVTTIDNTYYCAYLINSFLATVNKGTDLPTGTPANAIYTQAGINLAIFTINDSGQYSSEIAGALHLTGGQLWEFDGVRPVEHGFQVYPESVAYTNASTGGLQTAQKYYYVFTYEWTDNQGNLHRSAPSIPLLADLTGAGTATSLTSLYVPTLRLTYKLSPNPVRIVGYRWSTAQQTYYQFTSITAPIANDTTVDYVTITDGKSDAQILGQTLLYTTGGVVENIAAPASVASALFKNRLFLIDAEDRNLVWYSKPIFQNTPVEMSDLFTIYLAPTSGAQGSTGDLTALSAMDDKLIFFKPDALYYMTGTGPDITGSNNDFNDPVYITSSVGSDNPDSIVLMPLGLMFQSDKGIWLLSRDLSTKYIGAPVEAFTDLYRVTSAEAIPGTNQVRFILGNDITLVYDYFQEQWATFTNIRAISGTLYQGRHTYLNSLGQVFQETPNTYLDGSRPVLMSFKTSWISLAGLQGYERFYYMHLLGSYYTPYMLNISMAYDYNESAAQTVVVSPDNYSPAWGGLANWGDGEVWGGPSNVFEARVFPEQQKCESFQVSMDEIYDASYGVPSGAGLTLSGLNLTVGVKKGTRTQKASRSFG